MATLATVASLPAGSGVALTMRFRNSLSLWDEISLTRLSARVAKIGEAFRLFLKPEEFSRLLGELGFTSIEDLGGAINTRYFQHRSDGLQIGSGVGRVLRAIVTPQRAAEGATFLRCRDGFRHLAGRLRLPKGSPGSGLRDFARCIRYRKPLYTPSQSDPSGLEEARLLGQVTSAFKIAAIA